MSVHLISTNNEYKYYGDLANLKPKQGKAFVDKMSMTLQITEKEHQDIIKTAFEHYAHNQFCKYASYSPYYKKSFYICLSDHPNYGVGNQKSLLIQFDPKDPTHNFIRFEWNPSKSQLSIIKAIIDSFLVGGYERLINHGLVTRVDTAVDIHNVSINSLIFYYPKIQKSEIYRKQKGEEVETIYLGDGTGVNQWAIYDKTKQWEQQNNKTSPYALCDKVSHPNYPVTRLEHRYRPNPSSNLQDLENVAGNAFSNLLISYYFKLLHHGNMFSSKLEEVTFKCFLDSVRLRGLQSALKMLDATESTQKKFRSIVKSVKVEWFTPDIIKKELSALIKAIQHPKDLPLPFPFPKFTKHHSHYKAA